MSEDDVIAPDAASAGVVPVAESAPDAANESPEYTGYEPLSYQDLNVKREEQLADIRSIRNTESTLGNEELDRAEAQLGRHLLANSSIVVFGISTIIALIGLIPPVSCGFQLCEKADRSPSGNTGLQLFDFIAPLRYVWAALSTGVAVLLGASLHFYFLRMNPLGKALPIFTGLRMRIGNRTFLKYNYFFQAAVCVPLFILVGFGVSWFTAGTFLFGVLFTVFLTWASIYIATYGSLCTLAASEDSFSKAVNVLFRSSASYITFAIAACIFGVSLSYLVFRDVRGLLGLAAGVSCIALLFRVSSGIFNAASEMARRTVARVEVDSIADDPRNPTTLAARVGESVDNAGGVGIDLVESFTASIVLAAISATSLPYVRNNPYALCVYNNLHIDYGCVGYGNNTQLVSFAAQICRQGLHEQFPSLTSDQSNSLFVAVPFLVAILGTLVVLVCTLRLVSTNFESGVTNSDRYSRTSRVFYLQSMLGTFLFVFGCIGISYGLFGSSSSFHQILSTSTFPRREFNSTVLPAKCAPTQDVTGDTGSNLPVLKNSIGVYRATNELGEEFPPPMDIPWRMLVVLMLGRALSLLLQAVMGYFTDVKYVPTSTIAKMTECGAADALIQGLGTALTSSTIPFMMTLAVAFGSHYLLGGYGVSLTAVSMLSASGISFVLGSSEAMAKSGGSISRMCKSSDSATDGLRVMEWVGSIFSLKTKSVISAAAFLTSIALVSDLMLVSHLIPTSKDIIGGISTQPLRHIQSADPLIAISPSVVVSILFGVLLPITFVALPLLGMARTGYALIVESRKQIRQLSRQGNSRTVVTGEEEESSVKKCVRISSRHALLETVLPLLICLVSPLIVGFGLGQRALIGFLLSTSSCAYLLSMLLMTAGSCWRNARRIVEKSGGNDEMTRFAKQCAMVADDAGLFLERISTPGLAIYSKLVAILSVFTVTVMKADESLWYVGVSILGGSIVLGIVVSAMRYSYQKKLRKKASEMFGEDDKIADSGSSRNIRTDHQVVASPFYEDSIVLGRQRFDGEMRNAFDSTRMEN